MPGDQRGCQIPRAGVPGGCQPLDVGAGNPKGLPVCAANRSDISPNPQLATLKQTTVNLQF